MKKIKQPGENISLKTKKNESPDVMDWINGQSNLMDSIRYLVENEIRAEWRAESAAVHSGGEGSPRRRRRGHRRRHSCADGQPAVQPSSSALR